MQLKEVKTRKYTITPKVRVRANGLVYFNMAVVELLELRPGRHVSFAFDEDDEDLYLYKNIRGKELTTPGGERTKGLQYWDMPVAKQVLDRFKKKDTVSLIVSKAPIEIDGFTYYKIKL